MISVTFSKFSGKKYPENHKCNKINEYGSSVHGILQARVLELVVVSISRESSQHQDQNQVSYTAGRFFTVWTTREAQMNTEEECKKFFTLFL